MNAQKAKSIRKAVRNMSRHPREVELASGDKPYFMSAFGKGPGYHFLGQRILTKTCGRGLYKSLKRAVVRREVRDAV